MASAKIVAPRTPERIASIVGSLPLAEAINESISFGLKTPAVNVAGGKDTWSVFNYSLTAAIRNIETHPLGLLFKRLIEYGPHNPDEPEAPASDNRTILSDPECAKCVEFIYSHMINRFKGEIAELLAVKPTIALVKRLQNTEKLPSSLQIYFGDTIQEQRKAKRTELDSVEAWSGFAKGADGLVATEIPKGSKRTQKLFAVCGVIEVKSMYRSSNRIEAQLNHHLERLAGGIKVMGKTWGADSVRVGLLRSTNKTNSKPVFVMVIPSSWKIERKWWWEEKNGKRVMHFPDPSYPIVGDETTEVGRNYWRIKLAWSQEALNQAAYEMTYWYMSQVGKAIYSKKSLPKEWKGMSPEEAGYNAIKMMLYYIPLRIKYFQRPGVTRKQLRRYRQRIDKKATRLYNVYSFGYPLGSEGQEMLWPEDFDDPSHQENRA